MKRHTLLLLVLALAASVSIAGIVEQRRLAPAAEAQLWFFDVGQGDSALIRDAGGKDLLIDGGPDQSVLEGLAGALPFWDRKIDVMLVTHLDSDHYAGLFDVLKKYDIGEIWWTGAAPTTSLARRFVSEVEQRNIPQHFVRAGDRLSFAEGKTFTVLWPRENMKGIIIPPTPSNAQGGGTNDAGIVGSFACGSERALFTADISAHVEAALLDAPEPLRSALLKVGHHGSAHSSSEAFLDAVHPREAIISDGAGNRYGHPAPRVLAALQARGIRIRRTDREGTVQYLCRNGAFVSASARHWWDL